MALGYRCKNSADFYPRPPRGGRPLCLAFHNNPFRFLSTPSARRATFNAGNGGGIANISIHALREEGDRRVPLNTPPFYKISIHALREEGDGLPSHTFSVSFLFLSTPSARRATATFVLACLFLSISIHALREEGDMQQADGRLCSNNFYPRPPRGGRLWILDSRL